MANSKNNSKTNTKNKPTKIDKNANTKSDKNKIAVTPMPLDLKTEVAGIIVVAIGIIFFLGVYTENIVGLFGQYLKTILIGLFGLGGYILPVSTIIIGVLLLLDKFDEINIFKQIALSILFISIITFMQILWTNPLSMPVYNSFIQYVSNTYDNGAIYNGGLIGGIFGNFLISLFNKVGSLIITVIIILILTIYTSRKSFVEYIIMAKDTVASLISKSRENQIQLAKHKETIVNNNNNKNNDVDNDVNIDVDNKINEKEGDNNMSIFSKFFTGKKENNHKRNQQNPTENAPLFPPNNSNIVYPIVKKPYTTQTPTLFNNDGIDAEPSETPNIELIAPNPNRNRIQTKVLIPRKNKKDVNDYLFDVSPETEITNQNTEPIKINLANKNQPNKNKPPIAPIITKEVTKAPAKEITRPVVKSKTYEENEFTSPYRYMGDNPEYNINPINDDDDFDDNDINYDDSDDYDDYTYNNYDDNDDNDDLSDVDNVKYIRFDQATNQLIDENETTTVTQTTTQTVTETQTQTQTETQTHENHENNIQATYKDVTNDNFNDNLQNYSNNEVSEVHEERYQEVYEEFEEDIEEDIEEEFEEELEEEFEEDIEPYVYTFPSIDLLRNSPATSSYGSRAEIIENSKKLEDTLKSFDVQAKVVEVSVGPSITRYELAPGVGVKVSKIINLSDDLALNLAAQGIRIEAPIPGKAAVGIEVPNKEVQPVFLKEVINTDDFMDFRSKLAFAVGKDISGEPVVADIADMPHMLIAGATGSGKSVCINTLIISIIYKSSPSEVKLLMIDPKVVELNVYNGIPHLLIPVVTDPKKAAGALNWAVKEMIDRYEQFARSGCRDLKGYNEVRVANDEEILPQIVIIIDELADLMMTAAKEVEESICRLAQLARAAGIHLIIATQRPSVNVITGLIKANIPSRIAFAVATAIDSRTVLDTKGAEKLIGKGDMLFFPRGLKTPIRIQGAFISNKEVVDIVNEIKLDSIYDYDANMIESITSTTKGGTSSSSSDGDEDEDEVLDDAVQLVVQKGKASASMLQRQFKIGYNRASRLVEYLETKGFVGPEDGSKPRKVLMTQADYEEYVLSRTKNK